jgi:hypothetical protein
MSHRNAEDGSLTVGSACAAGGPREPPSCRKYFDTALPLVPNACALCFWSMVSLAFFFDDSGRVPLGARFFWSFPCPIWLPMHIIVNKRSKKWVTRKRSSLCVP